MSMQFSGSVLWQCVKYKDSSEVQNLSLDSDRNRTYINTLDTLINKIAKYKGIHRDKPSLLLCSTD